MWRTQHSGQHFASAQDVWLCHCVKVSLRVPNLGTQLLGGTLGTAEHIPAILGPEPLGVPTGEHWREAGPHSVK